MVCFDSEGLTHRCRTIDQSLFRAISRRLDGLMKIGAVFTAPTVFPTYTTYCGQLQYVVDIDERDVAVTCFACLVA